MNVSKVHTTAASMPSARTHPVVTPASATLGIKATATIAMILSNAIIKFVMPMLPAPILVARTFVNATTATKVTGSTVRI